MSNKKSEELQKILQQRRQELQKQAQKAQEKIQSIGEQKKEIQGRIERDTAELKKLETRTQALQKVKTDADQRSRAQNLRKFEQGLKKDREAFSERKLADRAQAADRQAEARKTQSRNAGLQITGSEREVRKALEGKDPHLSVKQPGQDRQREQQPDARQQGGQTSDIGYLIDSVGSSVRELGSHLKGKERRASPAPERARQEPDDNMKWTRRADAERGRAR